MSLVDPQRAADRIDEIAALPDAPLGPAVSLATGPIGAALWLAAYADSRDSQAHADRADVLVDQAIAAIAAEPSAPSLFDGFVGVAWALAALELGDDEMFAPIDAALAQAVPHLQDASLADGLVGIGVYALARDARSLVEAVVARLAALALPRPNDSRTWWKPPREGFPHGTFEVGVAHGVAGIAGFLARANTAAAAELLDQAMRWLALVPAPYPARLARDLDITASPACWATSMSGAAAAIPRPEALELAQRIEGALPTHDLSLRTGAAGLAHAYHRLFRRTGQLADQAQRWFEVLLTAPLPDHRGLLDGTAGIGLVLLSAVADPVVRWEHALMIEL